MASRGFDVLGVDIDPEKVRRVNDGLPPVEEPLLAETIVAGKGRLRATVDHVRGRIPVLTGVAEYTTTLACRFAADAARIGVDGLMVLRHAVTAEHLAKFPKLFCGLSLIFHLIELADTGKRETYIPLRVAKMAGEWCACLESHARRIYSLVKNPSLFSAVALADKITNRSTKTALENGFTAREVFRRQWRGVNTYDLINAALARLEETRWIRSVVTPLSKSGVGQPFTMKSTPKSSVGAIPKTWPNKRKKGGFVRTG
jgi:hypothetical protein